MTMSSSSSSYFPSPPASAFQSLPLTKTRTSSKSRQQRRSSRESSSLPKTPVDPMDDFLDDEDFFPAKRIDDPQDSEEGLFEQLLRNFENREDAEMQKACLGAFCGILAPLGGTTTPPPRAAVDGLWSQVVVPEYTTKLPELVAQDVWSCLGKELQFLKQDSELNVRLAHTVYLEFAKNSLPFKEEWRKKFGMYLQRSLLDLSDDRQPNFRDVQIYAIRVLVKYWLDLGETELAGRLLHQPSLLKLQWELLIKKENHFQITSHHTSQMEQYLLKLDDRWQEALGLYQGWHTMLQQELETKLEDDWSSASSSNYRSRWRRRRRNTNAKVAKNKNSKSDQLLLTLGRCLYSLSMSLDSILTELPNKSSALSVLWKRQSEYLQESMQVYSMVPDTPLQCMLSTASWLALAQSSATLEESECEVVADIDMLTSLYNVDVPRSAQSSLSSTPEVICYHVARQLLERSKPEKGAAKQIHLVWCSLKAELQDLYGRWLYDRQLYAKSRAPLEEATKLKRQVLTLLRDQSQPSILNWWGRIPQTSSIMTTTTNAAEIMTEEPDELGLMQKLLFESNRIPEMEIGLSQSLEYAALALHACDLSMAALSWLQEALILKTTHLGKFSLEVARLNTAMAVVHEDLLQWEAGLSRYRESLRIRMHVLSGCEPEWTLRNGELFRGILQTLRAMGNSHRMLSDHDNAVGCYWKIAKMARKEWEILKRTTGKTTFWGFDSHSQMGSDLRTTPLPTLVLDEERYSTSNKRPPPPVATLEKSNQFKMENVILFEAAQAYQTILSLFKDESNRKAGNTNLANSVGLEDVPLLLAASYNLGMIHIHFGDFRSAISSLEHSLHSIWILDPSSSEESGSDSAYSSDEEHHGYKKQQKRKNRSLRGIFGKEMETVDDEGVYHALGICRAACGEHDQAVRFHLTALRCARRMYGVNSIRASEILYDAATSYWHLKEYDKAGEFWGACLQIRTLHLKDETGGDGDDGEVDEESIVLSSGDVEYAKILYNTAASLCAMGRYSDPRTLKSLEQAKEIFSERFDILPHIEVANCLFYMAVTYYKRASPNDTVSLKTASVHLNRASSIYRTLGHLSSGDGASDFVDVALQAHIRFLEGNIAEALGKQRLAIDTYVVALRLYRQLDHKVWMVYVASVLSTMGKLYVKMSHDSVAIIHLDEALSLRRESLGRDHEAVGDTLFQMADIYSRMEKFQTSMEMYHEALRIQLEADGNDSPTVALTLLKIASLYARQNQFEQSMEKLKGALAIRKERVDRVDRASRVVSFWSGDLADDYLFISNKREESKRDESDGGNHVRKTLQDDMIREEVGLAIVLHCMGNVHVQLHEYEFAKDCYEQSLRVRRRHPVTDTMVLDGDIRLHVSDTLHNLGCLYELTEDYDNALKYFATSLKLKHRISAVQNELPRVLSKDKTKEQIVIYEGKGSLDGTYLVQAGSLSYASTLHRIGTVHHRLGNEDISFACLESALQIQKHYLGSHHFTIATTYADMASVLRNIEGRREDSLKYYKQAHDIRKFRHGSSADVGHLLYQMGTLYDTKQDYNKAIACYHQAIRVYGRRYVNTVGHHFCQAIMLRNSSILKSAMDGNDSDCTPKDIFNADGVKVRSIEETDDMIRSHFATISGALREASKQERSVGDNSIMLDLDLNAPDCWVSLELYLLSLYELFSLVRGEWRGVTHLAFQHALKQLEEAGTEGRRKNGDDITFQMLYLIQE